MYCFLSAFSKWSREFIRLDCFDQLALSRHAFGFYRKPTPEVLIIDNVLAKCNDIPGFPYLNKSILVKCVKLELWYKHQNKKLHVHRRCYVVAQRHKYSKSPRPQITEWYEISNQKDTWSNHKRNHGRTITLFFSSYCF